MPDNLPTSSSSPVIALEVKEDDVGVADDLSWQGGATGLPHQGCPITVANLQVVKATRGMVLDVKGSEFQHQHCFWAALYFLRLLVAVWVLAGIVW